MLNDAIIVQSAISAFNNAALAAPAFLWWAILALPLFVLARVFGSDVLKKLNWGASVLDARASLVVVILSLIWLVLFGGNFGVLRDGVSLLPFMTAAILFAGGLFIGTHTRNVPLPVWRALTRRRKVAYICVILAAALMLAQSDLHAWWGPILQMGALVVALVIGRASRAEMRAVPGAILIMLATTTAILMQPEFFRFGQLGNLTMIHLLFVMLVGLFAAATVATRNVNPRGRIHRSAYVKLKWMARFVSILGVALFFLTESVPIFLGTMLILFISFAMSVWNAKTVPDCLGRQMFAATMIVFGIITVMPAISALGIICCGTDGFGGFWHDSKFLL